MRVSEPLSPMKGEERMKYEIARELGLTDKLLRVGWGGLTAGETGRIGGLTAARRTQRRRGD